MFGKTDWPNGPSGSVTQVVDAGGVEGARVFEHLHGRFKAVGREHAEAHTAGIVQFKLL